MTLTEFLLERIAEDARTDLHADYCESHDRNGGLPCDCWVPARILADCEAKRRVVERHVSSEDARGVGQYRDGVWTPYCEYESATWPCPDIADLAAIYADHPDYNEEWKVG